MQNPNWIFAGVFADDGRSATNTFRRMIFNPADGPVSEGEGGHGQYEIHQPVCQAIRWTASPGEEAQGKNVAVYLREGKPQHSG